MDGVILTCLFTDLAAYAADIADLSERRAFLMGRAGHVDIGIIRYRMYDMLRTCIDAFKAAGALFVVDDSDSVLDVYCVKLACLYAASKAQAAILAYCGAAG